MSYEIPKKVEVFGQDIHREQLRYHRRKVRVSKEFTFDSAHHLHCYEGKCKNLHGHTYRLKVVMIGETDDLGFVIDFSDMKRMTKERVLHKLDHRYLNEVLPPMNTTAENMAVWIYEQLHEALVEEDWYPRVKLDEIKLWETPTSYAAVTRDLMEG